MNRQVRVNPYELFKLDPDKPFTRGQVKQRMRELVLVTHPDKPSGSNEKFHIVTECFKFLLQKVSEQERLNAPVTEQNVDTYAKDTEIKTPSAIVNRVYDAKGKFNAKKFNKFYEETQLDDPLEQGHGDWLKRSTKDRTEENEARIGRGEFQQAFEEGDWRHQQMIRHNGIIPMNLKTSKLQCRDMDDLGAKKHYYAGHIRCANGATAVDLRESYEPCRVKHCDTLPEESQPVTLEHAKRVRENARLKLSESEIQMQNQNRASFKQFEEERLRRIKKRDQQVQDHYNRITKMITYS